VLDPTVRCSKNNNFQFFLLFAIEMAVLSVFLQKKDLGPLGVKSIVQRILRGIFNFQFQILLKFFGL